MSDTHKAVRRLAADHPDWLSVLEAACVQARESEIYSGQFPGHAVLEELGATTGNRQWRPGLRRLVSYGLLEKAGESTRGGHRAYYRMPDRTGVERRRGSEERHSAHGEVSKVHGVATARSADRDRHVLGAQRRGCHLPLAEDAEPPDVVPSAVAAGRPVVRAHGEVDPPPGLVELGRDLDGDRQVVGGSRDHHPERLDRVVAGVGGVEAARGVV